MAVMFEFASRVSALPPFESGWSIAALQNAVALRSRVAFHTKKENSQPL
jgi:hypothetical protein